jgi:hypothetical protein
MLLVLFPVCVSSGLIGLVSAPAALADAGCNMYAAPAPEGKESNSGLTEAQPKFSPIKLAETLKAGQTGCLKDGGTFILTIEDSSTVKGTAGTAAQPVTLRPATPGSRATIRSETKEVFVAAAAHDLVMKDLNIRRDDLKTGGSLFNVDGDRVTLDGLDLTYPRNICLDVGGDPREKIKNEEGKWVPNPNFTNNPTEDLTIRNSRIYGCGSSYGGPHFGGDSGVHGIYLEYLRDGSDADTTSAIIENNLIYNNDTRGLQLYPDVDNALIQYNVLDGNGANLNIGSDREENKIYSEHNVVTNNIITDSRLDGAPPNKGGFIGDTSEILGNFPTVGSFDNHVDGNCVGSTTTPLKAEEPAPSIYGGTGYTHVNNIQNVDPKYKNKAAGDYSIPNNSPCVGKGPQPVGGPSPSVTKVKPATGPASGGTKLTLTGTNFTAGTTTVSFGEFEEGTEVTVTSPTSLTVVSPFTSEARIADVRVTTPGGTSAMTPKDHFKYIPVITAVEPNHGPASGGTYVVVHGEGFSLSKPVTFKFGATAATTIECPFQEICTVYSPAHAAGRVDVRATIEKLTSAKKPADRYTYE